MPAWGDLLPALASLLGMLVIAAIAWGKFNQLIHDVSRRVATLEDDMSIIRGQGDGAAVTNRACQAERMACSRIVCTKLDGIQETIRMMEQRREEARKGSESMQLHLTKIAQYIEDKDGKKINGK